MNKEIRRSIAKHAARGLRNDDLRNVVETECDHLAPESMSWADFGDLVLELIPERFLPELMS